jgi:hypothetical protein
MNPSRPTHPFRPRYLIAGLAAVVLALLLPAVASA